MNNRVSQRRVGKGFIERNITSLAETLGKAALSDEISQREKWVQTLDPRAKIVGIGLLIVAAVSVRQPAAVAALWLAATGLALSARIPWHVLMTQVWFGVLAFTGLMALPAVFLTPGKVLVALPVLGWLVTAPGLRTAFLLVARAETTSTLALTLVLTTRWTHVLKALRVLGLPTVLVVILGMTHRYIFLLLRLAGDFFLARRSRLVGPLDGAQRRQVAAGAAGVLLGKSLQMSSEVYQAMQSRGFRGEVYTLDNFCWRVRDSWAVAGFFAVAALALFIGLK